MPHHHHQGRGAVAYGRALGGRAVRRRGAGAVREQEDCQIMGSYGTVNDSQQPTAHLLAHSLASLLASVLHPVFEIK